MSSRSRPDTFRSITKVYIGGLKEDIGNDQLQDEFERFGPIKTVWIARNPSSKGYAFVDYYDAGHALDAVKEMDGQLCFGARLKVQLSRNELDKDKERSSSRRRSEDRYDRRDKGRRHGRSESPGSDSYDSRRSPRRRSNTRSPLPERRRSDSPESTSQSSKPSSDPLQFADSSLLRDSLLRNALTLLLLRDPLLLSASSSLGLQGVQQRSNGENHTRARPRPYDRPDDPAHRQDILRILRESLSPDAGDILAQQAALQNFVLSQSSIGCLGMQHGTIPQLGLATPAPGLVTNQPPIFPVPTNLSKTPSSTTPAENQSDWYVNRYYGYHLQPTPFTSTGSALAPEMTSSASAQQIPQQQTTPTFPIRMPLPPSLPRPPRMQTQTNSTATSVRPPPGHWRGPPPSTSS